MTIYTTFLTVIRFVPSVSDITGVEPDMGSPEGGTLITIYGKHFSDPEGDIKAFISGKFNSLSAKTW